MGRKSSAKAQARPSAAPPPQGPPPRSFSPLLVVALLAAAIVVAGFVYVRIGRQADQKQTSTQAAESQSSQPTPPPPAQVAEVPEISRRPHPAAKTPPLPFNPSPPARPMEVVRATYKFAAEHPEVLSYVPCYCGCERSGHKGNTDCFVTARAENGDVIEWEPHGMT